MLVSLCHAFFHDPHCYWSLLSTDASVLPSAGMSIKWHPLTFWGGLGSWNTCLVIQLQWLLLLLLLLLIYSHHRHLNTKAFRTPGLCAIWLCASGIFELVYIYGPQKKVVPTPWPGIYWITGLCSCLYSGRHLHFSHFWFTFGHGNVFFNLFLLTKLTFLSKDTQYAHIIAYKVCIASLFYNVWPSFESILWPLVVTIWTTLKEHHLLALANSHTTAMYNIYIACKW